MSSKAPMVIKGGLFSDERGSIGFVNDFEFPEVKRFYYIRNRLAKQVRAWNGHQHEGKYFTVIQGRALVAAVRVDNWESPGSECEIQRQILDADEPAIFCIPPGYANGHMSLTEDTIVLVFSDAGLKESQADDIRFPPEQWPLMLESSDGGEEHA